MKVTLKEIIEKLEFYLSSNNYQQKYEIIKKIKKKYLNNESYKYFDTNVDNNVDNQEIIHSFQEINPSLKQKEINSIIKHNTIDYYCSSLFEDITMHEWREEFKRDMEKLLDIDINLNENMNIKILDEFKYFLPKVYPMEDNSYCCLGQGSLPLEWLCCLKLDKIISKATHNQGELNGPDMIFLNKFTKEKIGIEIAYLRKTHFIFSTNNIKNKRKYINKIMNSSLVQKNIFQLANCIIDKHTLNMSGYEKCNKYYLVLITETGFYGKDYMYPLLEYYCNNYNKINSSNMWTQIYIF